MRHGRSFLRLGRVAAILIGALVVGTSGCRDDAPARTLDDPWLPGNGQLDESCAQGCEDFIELHLAHQGDEVIDIKVAAELDDPLAQWGECIGSFFACWEADEPVPGCVASSSCPEPCKAQFTHEVAEATTEEEEIYAFNRVFVDDDAPYRQPEIEQEVAP